MTTRRGFGEGASPALHGDTLVVNWDHEGDSFIVALDAGSGRELWRRERDEVTSWSTPLIVAAGGPSAGRGGRHRPHPRLRPRRPASRSGRRRA